ncbi:unnamed protein product [Haemonchus placei]|uniref:DUF1758 domain-containing protein n=1 Tax=Haemonchus placei TaxID=6290 RepID=A0A0N4W779_HAEPC|nr:unnamed protein product [Haemonchus placei]
MEAVNMNVNQKGLLMCAEVTLFDPDDPLQKVITTAFFESGATLTFISEELAGKLNLEFEKEELFAVETFATREPQTYLSSRVRIGLLLENQEMTTLSARTVPFVSGPMQMELVLSSNQDRLRTHGVTAQPGMLIGNDYFWDLVLSNDFFMKQLPNGYKLVHTRLGYVITGKPFQANDLCMSAINSEALEKPLQHQKLEELVEKFWSIEFRGNI